MTGGMFITFEGGEGAGKSTQAVRLAETLRATGREVVLTREPGGAPGAEAIRTLLVNGPSERWSPLAEALLFAAARDAHLRATIRPALNRGAIVLSDRFADSTRAYQGAGGGLSMETIDRLEEWVVGGTQPDLTFVLDHDPAEGLARAGARRTSEDRYERMDLGFHQRLRTAFLAIAAEAPARCVVIDAACPPDEVAAEIACVTLARLREPAAGRRA